MALQLQRGNTHSFGKMLIASFAVLAFVLQPLVSLNLPSAFATGGLSISVNTPSANFISASKLATQSFSFTATQSASPLKHLELTPKGGLLSAMEQTEIDNGHSNWANASYLNVPFRLAADPSNPYTAGAAQSKLVTNGAGVTVAYTSNANGGVWTINLSSVLANNLSANGNQFGFSAKVVDTSGASSSAVTSTYTVGTVLNVPQKKGYQTVQAAIADADPNEEVKLLQDQSTSSQVVITKPLTLNGNGLTLSSSMRPGQVTQNPKTFVEIESNDVTIKNLRVHSYANKDAGLNGINVFGSQNVKLDNVTSDHHSHYGIVVACSDVEVTNVKTNNNGWGGIDVDCNQTNSDMAYTVSHLTVNGTSVHDESLADIKVDNSNTGNGSAATGVVKGTNSQYTSVTEPNPDVKPADPKGYPAGTTMILYQLTSQLPTPTIDSLSATRNGTPLGSVTNVKPLPTWFNLSNLPSNVYQYRYELHYSADGNISNEHLVGGPQTNVEPAIQWSGYQVGGQGDGIYTYYISYQTFQDGPWSSAAVTSVTYDHTAPALEITKYVVNGDGTYTISGTTDDSADVIVSAGLVTYAPVTPVNDEWSITTGQLEGKYDVSVTSTDSVYNQSTVTEANHTFHTPAGPTTLSKVKNKTTNANAVRFFAANRPAGTVLGATDTASDDDANAVSGDAAVKGASTTKDDNNTDTAKGFAWYWWVVILAAIALLWWLIAAARRRKNEA